MTMENLLISATKSTPAVSFLPEQGIFSIVGRSLPENASDFYAPVLDWLEANLAELRGAANFAFDLTYFNSSSMKALFMLLSQIKERQMTGQELSVAWYVEDNDEFMTEAAETMMDLTGIKIEIRPGHMSGRQ